jgi:hypothetical protein
MPELSTILDDDFTPSVYVPIIHPMGLYNTLWTNLTLQEAPKWEHRSKSIEDCTADEKQVQIVFQFNVINDPAKPYLDKEQLFKLLKEADLVKASSFINKKKFVDGNGEERDMVLTVKATKTYSAGGGKGQLSTLTKTLNGIIGRTLSKEEAGTLSLRKFFMGGYHPVDVLLGIEDKDGERYNKVVSVQRTPIFLGKATSSIDITPYLLADKIVQAIREEDMKDHFEDQ